ncbi:MAG TPA: ribonuclease Y [Candidatus Paceibacterota bacterium]|nr:ribonuclease Y [Candidatus Paceibacterota bacterium]
MSLTIVIFLASASGLVGIALGYYLRLIISLGKRGSMELEIKKMELDAEEAAKNVVLAAESKAAEILQNVRQEAKEKEDKIKVAEDRIIKKEDALDARQKDLDQEVESLKSKIGEIRAMKERADALLADRQSALERVAGLSEAEAKEAVLKQVEEKYANDLLVRMQKFESANHDKIEAKAKDIIATAIQRLGNSVTADVFSTSVTIPSEEIKGKIIGKEGRNIKSFERATGVEVIIDDTPGAITLSSFDPIRRQVARMALEELIKDGRIQPAKIEKLVEKAKEDINKVIKEKGEQAAYEVGVMNLDPRIISILGRLHFRTSYGQNVLAHSVEMAHIAGMIAEELGANVQVAKAGALVHDIGKALDHEVQGTHVEIGRRILQKFGADEAVIKAMQAHHEEYPYETVESIIVQTADAISGSRPGARRDSVENYLKRLQDLEAIATGFKGVEKAYALQAGREIRVFVKPEEVSDLEAKNMGRGIAEKIEKDLKYPGEIKVTVIRESRAVEFAR